MNPPEIAMIQYFHDAITNLNEKAKAARNSSFSRLSLCLKHSPMQPFILTLQFDSQSFEYFNALRRQYFPRERNYLDAHLTLFHALPAEAEPQIRADLGAVAASLAPLELRFPALRFMGKGVAVEVEAPALVRLRRDLSDKWRPLLGAQDSRVIKPHITIQNKVTPEKARALFDKLDANWQPFDGIGIGLQLWRYKGGPWEAAGGWEFVGA